MLSPKVKNKYVSILCGHLGAASIIAGLLFFSLQFKNTAINGPNYSTHNAPKYDLYDDREREKDLLTFQFVSREEGSQTVL